MNVLSWLNQRYKNPKDILESPGWRRSRQQTALAGHQQSDGEVRTAGEGANDDEARMKQLMSILLPEPPHPPHPPHPP